MVIALGSNYNNKIIAKILKTKYNFETIYISRKIYISCSEVFGISYYDYGNKDVKNTKTYKLYGMSADKLLQEYIKALLNINKDIFSILLDRVLEHINDNIYTNFVIPDVKRLCECVKLRQYGAVMINVKNNKSFIKKELNKLQWDFEITLNDNAGKIDENNLNMQIDCIMSKLGVPIKKEQIDLF